MNYIWFRLWIPYSIILLFWGFIIREAGQRLSLFDTNTVLNFLDTGPDNFATAVLIYIVISYKAITEIDKELNKKNEALEAARYKLIIHNLL